MANPDAGTLLTCIDYTGSEFTASIVQQACASIGTYLPNGCPTAMRLGGCVQNCGMPGEAIGWYYQGIFTSAAQVQMTCTQNQTFVP